MRARILGLVAAAAAAATLVAPTGVWSAPAAAPYPRSACPAPGNVGSYHVYSLSAHAISCDHARHLLIENLAHHRRHSYTCTFSMRGTRDVSMHCTDASHPHHQYSAGYRVH